MLNDFTALAMAIRHLPQNELEQIGGGRPVPGMPARAARPRHGTRRLGTDPDR